MFIAICFYSIDYLFLPLILWLTIRNVVFVHFWHRIPKTFRLSWQAPFSHPWVYVNEVNLENPNGRLVAMGTSLMIRGLEIDLITNLDLWMASELCVNVAGGSIVELNTYLMCSVTLWDLMLTLGRQCQDWVILYDTSWCCRIAWCGKNYYTLVIRATRSSVLRSEPINSRRQYFSESPLLVLLPDRNFLLICVNFLSYFGEGNGNPLQYSWLENPMNRGAQRSTVHGSQRATNTLYYLSWLLLVSSSC